MADDEEPRDIEEVLEPEEKDGSRKPGGDTPDADAPATPDTPATPDAKDAADDKAGADKVIDAEELEEVTDSDSAEADAAGPPPDEGDEPKEELKVELEPIDVGAANDEDLMYRCALGDLASYDELFKRYNRASLSFLHRMLGDFGRTESIAQEAFLRIFRDAESYDYPRKFSTWFYTILRNLAKNELRYRSRHYTLSLEEELARSEGQMALRIRDCLKSPGSGPLQEVLDGELEDRLRQAIETLPEKAREVLILHRFQGLNYREIAEITEAPLGTVRSRLHSALNHIRKEIKDLL